MPTIGANVEQWVDDSVWVDSGDDWSEAWGGPEKQWLGCVLPRIQRFLPASSILEIAPGFGRWTHYLQQYCDTLTAVDLSTNCVEACKRRFAGSPKVSVFLNDGKSLAMIEDESVDFLFSFDSLVHAGADATDAYLSQMKRILKPEGAVFLHHSNYGAHRVHPWLMALGHVRGLRKLLWRFRVGGLQENRHWRTEDTSAVTFRESCQRSGLRCFDQELVNWGVDFLNDCFSCVVRDDATSWPEGTNVRENLGFMDEAARIKATSIADLRTASTR